MRSNTRSKLSFAGSDSSVRRVLKLGNAKRSEGGGKGEGNAEGGRKETKSKAAGASSPGDLPHKIARLTFLKSPFAARFVSSRRVGAKAYIIILKWIEEATIFTIFLPQHCHEFDVTISLRCKAQLKAQRIIKHLWWKWLAPWLSAFGRSSAFK